MRDPQRAPKPTDRKSADAQNGFARSDQPRPNRRGLQRSTDLLSCAIGLFLERGFDGVSVNDLVAKVGGSKTNVYSYFGDKSGLFKAAMHALEQETLAPLQELDITDVALEVGLQRVARKLVETIRTKRHLSYQRLIFAEAARHPEIGKAWFRDGPVVAQSIIAQFLRRHQAEGRISPRVNVERAAVMFHDMVAWDPLLRSMFVLTTKNDMAALSHADEAVSLFVAAIELKGWKTPSVRR